MDTAFYVVSGIIALALFILIARNLYILDKKDRSRGAVEPPGGIASLINVLPTSGEDETPVPPLVPSGPDVAKEEEPAVAEKPPTSAPTERGLSQEEIDLLLGDQGLASHDDLVPELHAPPNGEPSPEPIQFSSYYPKEVRPKEWQPLIAYAFRDSAAGIVADDAKQQLGDKLQSYRETGEPARQPIVEGATITATPTLDGFQFNPPTISLGLFEDWHRFDFKLRADSAPLEQAANGRLTFAVEGVIVADLPLSIFVGETISDGATATVSGKPYDAIFCSYSRKDIAIVQRVERAYRALGNAYLRDMISIRSGEDWNEALKTLIERADIFQLFWSTHSCTSEHCKMEWDYALTLEPARDHFIRPVYWENPLPAVPDGLRKLHFAYEPELGS